MSMFSINNLTKFYVVFEIFTSVVYRWEVSGTLHGVYC